MNYSLHKYSFGVQVYYKAWGMWFVWLGDEILEVSHLTVLYLLEWPNMYLKGPVRVGVLSLRVAWVTT